MSIRAIAMEVYRCQKKVHELEELLRKEENRENHGVKDELRQAKAELKILKNMIEGRKAQSSTNLYQKKSRFTR